jgi:hypothetical protein
MLWKITIRKDAPVEIHEVIFIFIWIPIAVVFAALYACDADCLYYVCFLSILLLFLLIGKLPVILYYLRKSIILKHGTGD